MPSTLGGQKRVYDPLRVKLQMVVTCTVDAENFERVAGVPNH